jgi:DNA repair protein RecO (recombination protein O)
MSRTFSVTGINLKSSIMGESDRLLTILTPDRGLIKVAAPGARKQNAKLGGRSGLFVINDMLIAQGKSLDRLTQAETLESFPSLAKSLAKLTTAQYLVEIALQQAIPNHPQAELYYLLTEHIGRIEQASPDQILPCLTHGTYQLLALAGLAPQVQQCCLSGRVMDDELSDWPPPRKQAIPIPPGLPLDSIPRLPSTRVADRAALNAPSLPWVRSPSR